MNPSGIIMEGELKSTPVPRLLKSLYDQEQTGGLLLVQEMINKTIYLIQGVPVYVDSSLRDETLGRYLVKQGKITEEDFEKSLELMMSEGIQQGAALVKLGKIKPKELYQIMKAQTLYKIISAFSLQQGKYQFYPETDFISKIYRFEYSFPLLLKQGIYQYLPEEVLDQELKKLGAGVLAPLSDYWNRLKLLELTELEQEFAQMIDGSKTLIELINLEPAYPFARRLIYLLALLGMIETKEKLEVIIPEPALEPERPVPALEKIVISPMAPEAVEIEEAEEEKKSPDQIAEFYVQLKSLNYFELLEIPPEANDEQVETAYHKRLSEFERSRFKSQMEPELEAKLEEINTEIIKAYEALRTQARREQYLAQQKEKEEAKRVSLNLEAEKFLQEGIKFVRSRDWTNAQKMFEKAIELKPEEPEYYGYLGWSIYCNPELPPEERKKWAKEKIQQAIKMNPNMDSAHVFLGKIFKEEGKKLQAVYEFREAVRCNPNCREAKKELEAQGIKL